MVLLHEVVFIVSSETLQLKNLYQGTKFKKEMRFSIHIWIHKINYYISSYGFYPAYTYNYMKPLLKDIAWKVRLKVMVEQQFYLIW